MSQMPYFKQYKRFSALTMLGAAFLLQACSTQGSSEGTQNEIQKISLGIQGYEFGPAVNKLVVELENPVSTIETKDVKVETASQEREVTSVYLSDEKGNVTKEKSKYVTLELDVSYNPETYSGLASPFTYNLEIFMNEWAAEYPVSISDLTVGGSSLSKEEDAIANRMIPEAEKFTVRKEVTGSYLNPLKNKKEDLALHYAAFEPENIQKGEKNPLLIWLHGQGEGGTDIDITLLGNEVTALSRDEIQTQFTAGEEVGAYVLAVQAPTYWMDEGDGTNGTGAGVSRYTEILMDAIKDYVASNPDVDPNRIYLSGCSNGGYMTLNMAIHYPDYFAALVPNAPAYAYYQYERNEDGTYKTATNEETGQPEAIKLDTVWFDQEKVNKIKDIPMWFIHSADDTVVLPENYPLPVYKALVDAGAKNAWFSYYENVQGVDDKGSQYLGHWSWIYYFNNQVSGVQAPSDITAKTELSGYKPDNSKLGGSQKATVNGKEYDTVYAWLNDQKK